MVTRLAEDVWWFDCQGVNAYLVDSDAVTLVDTGMPWHAGTLQRGIETVVGTLAAVDRVLLTHFDFDHVGGLNRLHESGLDAPVYVGLEDEPHVSRRERPPWTNKKGLFQRVSDVVRSGPALPVETVTDGDTVGAFRAYHTPGHTPGYTAFIDADLSVAMVGDLVQERNGEFSVPPWFLNHDQSDAERSVRSFVDRAPAVDVVCQGHGTPFVDGGYEQLAAVANRRAEN